MVENRERKSEGRGDRVTENACILSRDRFSMKLMKLNLQSF